MANQTRDTSVRIEVYREGSSITYRADPPLLSKTLTLARQDSGPSLPATDPAEIVLPDVGASDHLVVLLTVTGPSTGLFAYCAFGQSPNVNAEPRMRLETDRQYQLRLRSIERLSVSGVIG